MSELDQVQVPEVENVTLALDGAGTLTLAGTIAIWDPSERLGPFFQRVHEAALHDGRSVLRVDVTGLSFVNSSAIRLFVAWATWLRKEPENRRYELRFVTDRKITWQRTSFAALAALAKGVVVVEQRE